MGNWTSVATSDENDEEMVTNEVFSKEIQKRNDQWVEFWIWLRKLFLEPRSVLPEPEPPAEPRIVVIEMNDFDGSSADLVTEPPSGLEICSSSELESESLKEQDSNTSLCNFFLPEVDSVPETLMVRHDLENCVVLSIPEASANEIPNDKIVVEQNDDNLPEVFPESEKLTEVVAEVEPLEPVAAGSNALIPLAAPNFTATVASENVWHSKCHNFSTISFPWLLRLRYSKFAVYSRFVFLLAVCIVVCVLYFLRSF